MEKYYKILNDKNTTGKHIASMCHSCLIDLMNSNNDIGHMTMKEENDVKGLLIKMLGDDRIDLVQRKELNSRITNLF